jgi:hypothetical protein
MAWSLPRSLPYLQFLVSSLLSLQHAAPPRLIRSEHSEQNNEQEIFFGSDIGAATRSVVYLFVSGIQIQQTFRCQERDSSYGKWDVEAAMLSIKSHDVGKCAACVYNQMLQL